MIAIGIDIGGTFTDLIAFDEISGEISACKVPTTKGNQAIGVMQGLERMKIDPKSVNRIVHGMTVGTNAILERKGAPTTLITTKGFRDLIEIGRTQRNAPGSLFQIKFTKEKPLVPRPLRFEINERTRYDGQVFQEVSPQEVAQISEEIGRSQAEAVAICFLHSYINPQNEQITKRIVAEKLPEMFVSTSSEVIPEYREYERFTTTVLNCYLMPVMDRYLKFLDQEFRRRRYQPNLFIMSSNGGVCTASQTRALPIRTILSGPVGGVNGAIFIGEKAGLANMITYDMGGTSTDVCLIENLTPTITTDNKIHGFPLKTPQVNINTVGAGGGSIAQVDVAGIISVGPESAGADPGPACYGRGGTDVTVTDANLYLNRLGVSKVLGGEIQLDRGLAESALISLSQKLDGMDINRLADGIVQIAVAKMVSSIREISIEKGKDPRDYVLIPFGGAGPMHAIPIAKELQIRRIFIPKFPGNLSALGLLASDLKLDLIKTWFCLFSNLNLKEINQICLDLQNQGEKMLIKEGFQKDKLNALFWVDMRYFGQAFELTVPYKPGADSSDDLRNRFYQYFSEAYGHGKESGELELVNVRTTVGATVPKPNPSLNIPNDGSSYLEARQEYRNIYFEGRMVSTPIYHRESLKPDDCIEGPAIVEEEGATTVIFPNWIGNIDSMENLILTPEV